jgi:cystathionine gamma-synthase
MADDTLPHASATLAPATLAAHAPHRPDPVTGAIVPPIHTATTYARDAAYRLPGPGYTRDENPTYRAAETLLATLERGADALLFSSGMAAATTAVQSLLRPGERLVASKAMYFGLRVWLEAWCAQWGVELRLVDATDLDAVEDALAGQARLLWVETPANPTWDVVDLKSCAGLARAAGALLAVDSTVATPVHTQPLSLGADLVMHSATKALNGHSDVLAGALVVRDAQAPWWLKIRTLRHDQGAVPGPFEAFLLLRGMRTLFVRVPRQSATALEVASRLEGHSGLEAVLYPGLFSHPGHDIARQQMSGGYGGLLSIRVRGGAAGAIALVGRLRVWTPATSLGGTESLIEHRATAEGPATIAPPDLLRLSAGLEDPRDLIDDLLRALG